MTQQRKIDLWYGNEQPIGRNGLSQRWANVLGRLSGPAPIAKLEYSLNGGETVPLSIGPDHRRLAA